MPDERRATMVGYDARTNLSQCNQLQKVHVAANVCATTTAELIPPLRDGHTYVSTNEHADMMLVGFFSNFLHWSMPDIFAKPLPRIEDKMLGICSDHPPIFCSYNP